MTYSGLESFTKTYKVTFTSACEGTTYAGLAEDPSETATVTPIRKSNRKRPLSGQKVRDVPPITKRK